MATAKQDAVLGVVFFLAIGLLLGVTLLLSNFSFGKGMLLEARFPNAAGLQQGDAVLVLGRRAGEVRQVEPRPGPPSERIGVVLQLDEPLPLQADAKIQISDASLLGGKRIEIDPGTAEAVLPAGTVLRGSVRKSAVEALGDELQGDDSLIEGIKSAVNKINRGDGTLGQLFNSPRLHDALVAAVDSLTVSLRAIEAGRGALGRFIHDQQVGDDLAATVSSARSIATKIDQGTGVLGVVVNDATVGNQFKGMVDDLAQTTRDVRDGRGTVGLLLRDDDTRSRVQSIVADVAELAAKARDPDAGLLGAMIADNRMAEDAKTTFASLREFADRAVHGDGLLARLVNDPDWGRRMGQILGQVQRAVEDAREAAPVGTFFQVLTGFF